MSSQPNQWYLTRDGKQHGPFTDADLANFAKLGQLQTSDLVWREGLSTWRPALTIFPEPVRAPAQALSPVNEPVRAQVPEPRRKENSPRTRTGPTWSMALIALTCSALVGAAGGYVFKHYLLLNTELAEGSRRK